MMGLRIDIRLKMMERHSHLYHYHLDRFMKINLKLKEDGKAENTEQSYEDK